MGTWGAGNFQDDNALDWLDTVLRPLQAQIASGIASHDEGNGTVIMAAVEVLALLCENLNATPPRPEEVATWHKGYVLTWKRYIDDLDPQEDYKAERLAVINATFERLLACARKWHEEEDKPKKKRARRRASAGSPANRNRTRRGSQPTGMVLLVNDRAVATDPDPDLIASTVLSMNWSSDIAWVTLRAANGDSMSCSGCWPDGFAADYREGGEEHISERALESVEEMVPLLQSYRAGDDEWRHMIAWG